MAFDTKKFIGYLLNEQAGSMQRRREKADIFEEEERAEAEQSRREISRRRTIVDGLVSEAKRLEQLGVTPAQIKAAAASGPQGLSNLSKAVQAEVKARGGISRLSEYDVSALIDASTISPAYDKMDYEEFLSRTAGLMPVGQAPEVDTRTILQKALGFDQKQAVRAKLDTQKSVGGYSILDINEMARGQAYSSLMPGAYATFSPGSLYDSEAALKTYTLASSKIISALDDDLVYQDLLSKDPEAAAKYKRDAYKPFALSQFKKYGMESAKDPVLNWPSILGEDNYKILLSEISGGDKQVLAEAENALGETTDIERTGPNGEKFIITTGKTGATKITLMGAEGNEKVITDVGEIEEFLNKITSAGLMDSNTTLLLQGGKTKSDLPSATAADAVVDRTVPTGLGGSGLGDDPKVDTDIVEEIFIPKSADEFKINGVTYNEWQGMSRKERKEKGLPEGELAAQFKFKRFQKGLGINTAAEQSVATFDNMGDAQLNIDRVEEDAVVTIGDIDYKVKTFNGEKYFEELETGSMQKEDVDDQFRVALKGILEAMRGKDLSDFPFILQDYAFDNDLPDDVVNRLGEEYDTIEAKLKGAGLQ